MTSMHIKCQTKKTRCWMLVTFVWQGEDNPGTHVPNVEDNPGTHVLAIEREGLTQVKCHLCHGSTDKHVLCLSIDWF